MNMRTSVGGKWRARGLAAAAALTFLAAGPLASAGPKAQERPFRGSCGTVITPQPDVPAGALAVLKVDVVCRLSHLGLTVGGTDREVVYPDGEPTGGILPIKISIEHITYIAANGDELWTTFAGSGGLDLNAGKATFQGIETFVGGTGRFAGASGQAHTSGEGSLVTNTGSLTTSGSVRY